MLNVFVFHKLQQVILPDPQNCFFLQLLKLNDSVFLHSVSSLYMPAESADIQHDTHSVQRHSKESDTKPSTCTALSARQSVQAKNYLNKLTLRAQSVYTQV